MPAPQGFARVLEGALLATAIALAAWRARSLSASGAVAACCVGTAAIAGGWAFGTMLIAYFVISSVLSRVGRAGKEARSGGVIEKGGARDAVQVAANGGIFAACALLSLSGGASWPLAAAGALAAATADTWATEIGMLSRGAPRSALTWRPVPPGTSGGMSAGGTLAMIAGASFIALLSRSLGLSAAPPVLAAGVAGALVDTVLGATFQEQRFCDACERSTERRIHDCGAATRQAGGMRWLRNDAVNFAASATGAITAATLGLLLTGH